MYKYYGSEEQFLRMILMVYFFVIISGLVFGLVRYILKSVGMYRMARNRGMDNAWLSWIPYARTYLQGELSGSISFGRQKIKNPGIWMILIPLISGGFVFVLEMIVIFRVITVWDYYGYGFSGVFNGIFVFLLILLVLVTAAAGIITKVLKVFVNRQIFEALTSESMALFHAVVSVFLPLYEDICFFVLRDKGRPAGYDDYMQKYSQIPPQVNYTDTPQNAPVQGGAVEPAAPSTAPEATAPVEATVPEVAAPVEATVPEATVPAQETPAE